MLRLAPLRTGRATFTASGSSKPRLVRWRDTVRSAQLGVGRPRVRSPRPWSRRLTCPLVGASSSPSPAGAHLTTSAPFGPGHQARYPAGYPRRLAEGQPSCLGFPLPFGCRHLLLGHPVPAGELGVPHGRLTGHGCPDPDGVSVFRTHELRPGWVPSIPRGRRCSPGPAALTGPRLPHHNGASLHPASNIPSREAPLHEASTRVQAIHPSGLPLTHRRPDGTGSRFGFSSSFAPRRYQRRTSRMGTGHRARTWTTLTASAEPPILCSHSKRATSRRTGDSESGPTTSTGSCKMSEPVAGSSYPDAPNHAEGSTTPLATVSATSGAAPVGGSGTALCR